MELRNVKTFVSVAGLMSFRRAAAMLNYAPSTVSAQVQTLEEELQLKLFDRLEKGIRLTEAGARFLPYAVKLLEMARESISAVAGEHARKGMLVIRMPETLAAYRFPALLPLFRQEYPTVGIRLRGSSTHDVQRYLEAGLDLAFLVGETRPAENCFIERIGSEELVLAGNVADWGTGSVRVEASDLAGRLMLCASSDSSGRVVLERFLNQRGLQGNVWIDFSSLTALKNSLQTTFGACALLPRAALRQELESGTLNELVLQGLTSELPVNMLWHREKWMSPSLTFFMELFRNAWKEAPSFQKRPPVVA
ncbi:MAG: LysR family transcriptional regulator [Deltaproteobacteria bacterium]|nr:LysR family transcriptional regulator [Deltaproteobacteria bacterium]